jgi:hypothetical protein
MKTTLTIITAIIVPGGLVILAIGLAMAYLHRHRARRKVAQVAAAATA